MDKNYYDFDISNAQSTAALREIYDLIVKNASPAGVWNILRRGRSGLMSVFQNLMARTSNGAEFSLFKEDYQYVPKISTYTETTNVEIYGYPLGFIHNFFLGEADMYLDPKYFYRQTGRDEDYIGEETNQLFTPGRSGITIAGPTSESSMLSNEMRLNNGLVWRDPVRNAVIMAAERIPPFKGAIMKTTDNKVEILLPGEVTINNPRMRMLAGTAITGQLPKQNLSDREILQYANGLCNSNQFRQTSNNVFGFLAQSEAGLSYHLCRISPTLLSMSKQAMANSGTEEDLLFSISEADKVVFAVYTLMRGLKLPSGSNFCLLECNYQAKPRESIVYAMEYTTSFVPLELFSYSD